MVGEQRGFSIEHHAEAYDKLMQLLGYNEYGESCVLLSSNGHFLKPKFTVIQAGDVGSVISRYMAKKYGIYRCKAHHTNTPSPVEPTEEGNPELFRKVQAEPLSQTDKNGLARTEQFSLEGIGYYKQLSTRPATVGYALRDSPVGLLAWMYEKMHDWSDDYP